MSEVVFLNDLKAVVAVSEDKVDGKISLRSDDEGEKMVAVLKDFDVRGKGDPSENSEENNNDWAVSDNMKVVEKSESGNCVETEKLTILHNDSVNSREQLIRGVLDFRPSPSLLYSLALEYGFKWPESATSSLLSSINTFYYYTQTEYVNIQDMSARIRMFNELVPKIHQELCQLRRQGEQSVTVNTSLAHVVRDQHDEIKSLRRELTAVKSELELSNRNSFHSPQSSLNNNTNNNNQVHQRSFQSSSKISVLGGYAIIGDMTAKQIAKYHTEPPEAGPFFLCKDGMSLRKLCEEIPKCEKHHLPYILLVSGNYVDDATFISRSNMMMLMSHLKKAFGTKKVYMPEYTIPYDCCEQDVLNTIVNLNKQLKKLLNDIPMLYIFGTSKMLYRREQIKFEYIESLKPEDVKYRSGAYYFPKRSVANLRNVWSRQVVIEFANAFKVHVQKYMQT